MKIKFLMSYPHSIIEGGGNELIERVKILLEKDGHEVGSIDYLSYDLGADILIAFGFTWISPEVLNLYKKKKVKIILFPIFDRTNAFWKFKMLSYLAKFPILNLFSLRNQLVNIADQIVVLNESEKKDIISLFGAKVEKINVIRVGISEEIISKSNLISKDLFIEKYRFKDFVFYPSASISKRKDQILLIKSLKNTGIKMVINGASLIQDGLENEFNSLVENDSNILVLGKMDQDMLVSCYKAAKVSVSLSHAETAGLVNLEAAYLGCNLVLSKIPAFKDYIKEYAIYVDWSEKSVKNGIIEGLKAEPDKSVKVFVEENYRWTAFGASLKKVIEKLFI